MPIHAKAQLIYSRDLRLIHAQRAKTKRAVVARLETPTHSRLDVVGLHCEDQGSLRPIAARGGAAALLRANLDELLDASLPAVVLGDFNAEPTSDEICHERCFFGRTTFHHLVDRHEIATGVRRRPFFVKAPGDDRSYYYRAEERWTTMDFLMVSRELKDRVPSISVLKKIADKSLLRGGTKRVPDQDISDHLPVLAELHFQ